MAKLLTKLLARPTPRRHEWHDELAPESKQEIDQIIDLWLANDRELRKRFRDKSNLSRALIEECGLEISSYTINRYIDGRKPNGKKSR